MIWTLGRSQELPLQVGCLGAWMSQLPGFLLKSVTCARTGTPSEPGVPKPAGEGMGYAGEGGCASKKAVAVTGAPKHATHTILEEAAALWAAGAPQP